MKDVFFCGNCGSKAEAGEVFCSNCGSRLDDGQYEPAEGEAVTENKLESGPRSTGKVKKGSGKKILVLSAIIAAVLLIGSAIYLTMLSPQAQERNQLQLGAKLMAEGKYDEAVLAYMNVIMLDENNIEARLGLSKAYAAEGKLQKAEKALLEALEIDGTREDLETALADIRAKLAGTGPKAEDEADEGGGRSKPAGEEEATIDASTSASITGMKWGNTPGNITNGGMIAAGDEFIYYVDGNAISKAYIKDRSIRVRLIDTDKTIGYLNVVDDIVYFCTSEDRDGYLYRTICSVKADGSGYTEIYSWNAGSLDTEYYTNNAAYYSANVIVIGDMIYFINESGNICVIKNDGTGLKKLGYDSCRSFCIEGDHIYYVNLNDTASYSYEDPIFGGMMNTTAGKLYRIGTDGSQPEKICDDGAGSFIVSGDWIYYSNYADGMGIGSEGDSWYTGTLYKVRYDGTGKTKISDRSCDFINISGDSLYFRDWNSGICSINTVSGEGKVLFRTTYGTGICLAGRELFYLNIPQEEETSRNHEYSYTAADAASQGYGPNLYSVNVDNIKPMREPEITEPQAGNTDDGFIIPYSGERYLTEDDIKGMTKEELALARNEIYARHGYIFKTEKYAEYFGSKPWYKPNSGFTESELNEFEKYNAVFIKEHE